MQNETPLYHFQPGPSPILLSIPHAGTYIPPDIAEKLTQEALTLADTDWHVPLLYDFAPELGLNVLAANFSRYVIDANRAPDGKPLYPGASNTELCPTTRFDGAALYKPGQAPIAAVILARRRAYWEPYHHRLQETLQNIRAKHGYAVLFDAHSIRSRVPRFFDGELPHLNFGTDSGRSADGTLVTRALAAARGRGYSLVCDGRFKGGYITRHYGRPDEGVHAIQLELSQITYMDEEPPYRYVSDKADQLKRVLRLILTSLLQWSPQRS